MNEFLTLFNKWLNTRNVDKENCCHNVIVTNKTTFPQIADLSIDQNNIAYISLESTKDVAEFYRYKDNEHFLNSSENVLNLEFDDVTEDKSIGEGKWAKALTEEQARTIVNFIDTHIGYDFIVHCRAGKSRSQAIFRYIMDLYSDKYQECPLNKYNPCLTPNIDVLTKLKRVFYKKNQIFK